MKSTNLALQALASRHFKVAFISQPEYFRFMYEQELDNLAEVKEFKLKISMPEADFAELLDYQADINLFFRGEFIPDAVLRRLAGIKVNLSSEPFPRIIDGRLEWTLDSLDRYATFRAIRHKPFDYVFHYDVSSLPFLEWEGLRLSGEFPFPVATETYSPMRRNKEWDVFFIGRSTPYRERYFGPLKHYFNFLHICHGVWGKGLVGYLNASRICLNVHSENEISWEPRLQMMLACGAFVISEKVTPNRFLRPGVDYVEVTNPHEMFDAVSHYIAHEDEREKIARNGSERVRNLLASNVAFTRLLEGILQNRYQKFQALPGRTTMGAYVLLRKFCRKISAFF